MKRKKQLILRPIIYEEFLAHFALSGFLNNIFMQKSTSQLEKSTSMRRSLRRLRFMWRRASLFAEFFGFASMQRSIQGSIRRLDHSVFYFDSLGFEFFCFHKQIRVACAHVVGLTLAYSGQWQPSCLFRQVACHSHLVVISHRLGWRAHLNGLVATPVIRTRRSLPLIKMRKPPWATRSRC